MLQNKVIKKPTIVALHGGPGMDHNYYDVEFLASAAQYAQVIFIDHRGNGQSIDPDQNHWNLKQWATDVHDFCEALSLDKPLIYGASMNNPIPLNWMDRTILSPDVSSHFKKELVTFNILNNLSNIVAPVLYLTNTTNPWHLYESAKKTAAAMINTDVKLIAYANCGMVAMDKKRRGIKGY